MINVCYEWGLYKHTYAVTAAVNEHEFYVLGHLPYTPGVLY